MRHRQLFTSEDARARGISPAALRWGDKKGRWRRVQQGVYADGPDDPSAFDRARARVLAQGGVARGHLAGVILDLDSVQLDGRPVRRSEVAPERIVNAGGLRCADALQTLVDLASSMSDDVWEQALESALRKRLTTIPALEAALPALGQARAAGTARIRRVLRRRPIGAVATGSLLETLMVQLARTVPGLPTPVRQFEIRNTSGRVVAYVDLAWPDLGLFIELDGQQHKGQPKYDASRETLVVSLTGWLCGRFTWDEVNNNARSTARRLAALAIQARRRPVRVS